MSYLITFLVAGAVFMDQQWKDITDYFKRTNDLVEWVIKRKQPVAVSHVDYDEEIKKIFVEEN